MDLRKSWDRQGAGGGAPGAAWSGRDDVRICVLSRGCAARSESGGAKSRFHGVAVNADGTNPAGCVPRAQFRSYKLA